MFRFTRICRQNVFVPKSGHTLNLELRSPPPPPDIRVPPPPSLWPLTVITFEMRRINKDLCLNKFLIFKTVFKFFSFIVDMDRLSGLSDLIRLKIHTIFRPRNGKKDTLNFVYRVSKRITYTTEGHPIKRMF